MNLEDLYSFYKILKADNLSFIYQGKFNDEITSRVIDLSEKNLENSQEQVSYKKRVSYLMAECFQNIVRHGIWSEEEEEARDEPSGIFVTRNLQGTYYIASGNLIESTQVENLREKLQTVNQLTKEGLKSLYMEVLQNDGISDKGGAGLGLIEMARKSHKPLDFEFVKYDDKYTQFFLQIKLRGKEALTSGVDTDTEELPIDSSIDFYRHMAESNIMMIQKGDFSQDTLIPVLRMIENNMQGKLTRSNMKKIVYHVLVEILQNIAHHGMIERNGKEGLFLIGSRNGHYLIQAGNFIEDNQIESFRTQLDTVNSLDKSALKELYKKTLLEGEITEKGGAGLGLIEMGRASTEPIEYQFIPVREGVSFFSLRVTL